MFTRKMKKGFIAIITAAVLIGIIGSASTSCSFDNEEEYYANMGCDTTAVTYSASVAPIMNQTCTPCHSPGGGSLPYFDTHATIKEYLDMGTDSNLIDRINFMGPNASMPQGGTKMPACDIRKIELWIADGYPNN